MRKSKLLSALLYFHTYAKTKNYFEDLDLKVLPYLKWHNYILDAFSVFIR